MSLIRFILPRFKLDADKTCDSYFTFLSVGDSATGIDLEKLKFLLTSCSTYNRVHKNESIKDNSLYYTDKAISLNGATFSYIADSFNYLNVNRFADILNKNDLLVTSARTNENVINIGGKSVRGYTFDINKLFKFGDFIPICTKESKPMYSIPIGLISYDRVVGFSVCENDNNMMYISGQSRSGKTNFCNVLSTQAAMKNMSVVIIVKSSSISDLQPNAKEYVKDDLTVQIPWKAIDRPGQITKITVSDNLSISVDDILDSFMNNYKISQRPDEKVFTLLVLDEVSDFSWKEKPPIRELLRKGSKYGISGILSTQYLNLDNGANMDDALRQCASFCLFNEADIPLHLSRKYSGLSSCIRALM